MKLFVDTCGWLTLRDKGENQHEVAGMQIHTYGWIIISIAFCFLAACQANESKVTIPTPLPMQPFLPYVFPEPSTLISAVAYREKRGSRIEGTYFESINSTICAELDGYELIEEGDFGLDREDYLARSSLFVDDLEWLKVTEPDAFRNELAEALITNIDPETGERLIVGQGGAGPYLLCWEIPLEEGLHEVEFNYRKTSGIILSYSWFFYIIP